MSKKNQIKKLSGNIILLLVFLFATTPKQFLHHLIAHHKHSYSVHSHCQHSYQEVDTKGFNCSVDDTVVDVPFYFVPLSFQVLEILSFQNVYSCFSSQISKQNQFCYSLRGPPII